MGGLRCSTRSRRWQADLAERRSRLSQPARDHHWQAMGKTTQDYFRDLLHPPASARPQHRQCPLCAESIWLEALVCKHCNHSGPEPELVDIETRFQRLHGADRQTAWDAMSAEKQARLRV